MNSILRYLIFSLIVGALTMAVIGCSQNEDVIQSQDRATIYLTPVNLPELNDSLYVYELWAVKVVNDVPEYTSLGKFKWDKYLYVFRDTAGNAIDNSFNPPDAWYDYTYIDLTVENIDDPDPANPSGVIMARDSVIDPSTAPIELEYPVSLFDAFGYFFVGTPTDDYGNLYNENKGIWLCSRTTSRWDYQDTLGIDSSAYAVTQADPDHINEYDKIGIESYDVETNVMVVFGYDTITDHTRLINVVYQETLDPNNDYILTVYYDLGNYEAIPYNAYSQSLNGLTDEIANYGWRYQPWVLLEKTASNANLDLPRSWAFNTAPTSQKNIVGDSTWVVLPLGAFLRADSADLDNKYLDNREVPNYPGEDFITNGVPTNIEDYLNLRLYSYEDVSGQEWGSLVVGLQPDPDLIEIDTASNFPLFFLSGFLRSNDGYGIWDPADPGSRVAGDTLHNWSNFLPVIEVDVVFGE